MKINEKPPPPHSILKPETNSGFIPGKNTISITADVVIIIFVDV
jgi:hypothetical protein